MAERWRNARADGQTFKRLFARLAVHDIVSHVIAAPVRQCRPLEPDNGVAAYRASMASCVEAGNILEIHECEDG